jgi:hypothetical protein
MYILPYVLLLTSVFAYNVITISPSGLRGYYLLGVASYIKQNYNLKNYVFSGASAGAWISLVLSYKGKHETLIKDVLDTSEKSKENINTLGKELKSMFLEKYTTDDFDLDKIHIGTVQVDDYKLTKVIHSNFETLEDTLDCCMVSSHVPIVMGKEIFGKYRESFHIDGGFDSYPYINGNVKLHIHPFIWNKEEVSQSKFLVNQFLLFLELFAINNFNFTQLYDIGYNDAKKNKHVLDGKL